MLKMYHKVKPTSILLKQETVTGSGISWAVCKSAPRSRQIAMPAPHHSVFYRPDALPAAQPTASKHWRHVECLCIDEIGMQQRWACLRLGVDSSTVVHQVRRYFHLVLLGGDVQRRVTVLRRNSHTELSMGPFFCDPTQPNPWVNPTHGQLCSHRLRMRISRMLKIRSSIVKKITDKMEIFDANVLLQSVIVTIAIVILVSLILLLCIVLCNAACLAK